MHRAFLNFLISKDGSNKWQTNKNKILMQIRKQKMIMKKKKKENCVYIKK